MDNTEIWRPVKGYEGVYEVSNLGNVRSIDRVYSDSLGKIYHRKGVMLTPKIVSSGYYSVSLSDGKRTISKKVHQLVANAFIENIDNKKCIDHINTDRKDNRVENLRWVSLLENSNNPKTKYNAKYRKEKRIKKINVRKAIYKEDSPNRPRKLYMYDLNGNFIEEYPSMINAEMSTGIELNGIRKALNKSHRTAGGYLWRTDKVLFCEPYKHKRHIKCRPIIMLDSNGRIIKEWEAIRDAAIELKTTHTRIYNHIQVKTPIDGMYFKYK